MAQCVWTETRTVQLDARQREVHIRVVVNAARGIRLARFVARARRAETARRARVHGGTVETKGGCTHLWDDQVAPGVVIVLCATAASSPSCGCRCRLGRRSGRGGASRGGSLASVVGGRQPRYHLRADGAVVELIGDDAGILRAPTRRMLALGESPAAIHCPMSRSPSTPPPRGPCHRWRGGCRAWRGRRRCRGAPAATQAR
jgi:hypothetical protein